MGVHNHEHPPAKLLRQKQRVLLEECFRRKQQHRLHKRPKVRLLLLLAAASLPTTCPTSGPQPAFATSVASLASLASTISAAAVTAARAASTVAAAALPAAQLPALLRQRRLWLDDDLRLPGHHPGYWAVPSVGRWLDGLPLLLHDWGAALAAAALGATLTAAVAAAAVASAAGGAALVRPLLHQRRL